MAVAHPTLIATTTDWLDYPTGYSPVASAPDGVELFSLQAADSAASKLQARWHHDYLPGEDATLSQPAAVNVTATFAAVWPVQDGGLLETSLSFVEPRHSPAERGTPAGRGSALFTIDPGDLRSFLISRP